MRRLALTVIAVSLLAGPLTAADVPGFKNSYDEAAKIAEKTGKPLYLHFTTDWCSWCRKIENDTYTTNEAEKALENFVPASLDCTVPRGQRPSKEARFNIELMRRYGGGGYPYLVMVTSDHAVLGTISGYVPAERFTKELAQAKEVHEKYKAFLKEAKKADADDLKFQTKAMNIYTEVQKYDKAAEAARKVLKQDPKNKSGHAAKAHLVLLQQAWGTPPEEGKADAREKTIEKHLQAIQKLDPKNKNGVLEEAMFGEAVRSLQSISPQASKQQAATKVEKAQKTLLELVEQTKELNKPQHVYAYLAQTYLFQDKKDTGVEMLQKAHDADPSSPLAERLEQVISQLKSGDK
ncbi:MAG: thioredoxin fold domain-containing protein [Phycisphaerae bacterium]